MQQALDIQNNEHSELWRRTHRIDLKVEYRSKKENRTIVVVNPAVRIELNHCSTTVALIITTCTAKRLFSLLTPTSRKT